MTELYLIRHGIAAERGTYDQDGDRPLTEVGIHKTRAIAKRLRSLNLEFDLILTSPLVRAQQTAHLLQAEGLGDRLEVSPTLAPDGSLQDWLTWFEQHRSQFTTLALVGHEPDLSRWAEQLLWGQAQDKLILKKAGVIGLSLPEHVSPLGHSSLFWLTPPRFCL